MKDPGLFTRPPFRTDWRADDIAYLVKDLYKDGYVFIEKGEKVVIIKPNSSEKYCEVKRANGFETVACSMEILSTIPEIPDLLINVEEIFRKAASDSDEVRCHERKLNTINRVMASLNDPNYVCSMTLTTAESMTEANRETIHLSSRDMPDPIYTKIRESIIDALNNQRNEIQEKLKAINSKYESLIGKQEQASE